MPPAVPSGCSCTSRAKNRRQRSSVPQPQRVPAAGSATAGVNCDTSAIGPTQS